MLIVFLRIICLILLIFSILVDIDIPLILHTQLNQLLIAIIILAILLLFDEIIGFLLGLTFLIIYFKYYQKRLNKNSPIVTNNNNNNNNESLKEPLLGDVKPYENKRTEPITEHYINENNNCITMPYISNELLEKAQNNIYDPNNYKNNAEIQGLLTDPIQAFDGLHYSKL